ncbi:hypothetical protein [Brevundimonas sp. SL130]|uniref:hypothetical protein n=1 Tax=Brevundimonas sp. SL130 TaxID=2995143 RepID=UPI00226D16C4|nr:hypothetical protein [Brevundimonas sp. SL130]WAC58949.1 hypothetical protein OU998_12080 [Brevundimonas sp. SL130]
MRTRLAFIIGLSGLAAACATPETAANLSDGTHVVGRSLTPTAEDGAVTLECVLAEGGLLTDCVVISEQPSDQGYGEAALAMAARGVRVEVDAGRVGQKVRFTTRFRLQD